MFSSRRPALLREGARLLADMGASGVDVLAWVTSHGATDTEARNLCVEIVNERRGEAASHADQETLTLIDAGKIFLRCPADGFGLTGPDPIPYSTALRVRDLKDRRLAAPAYQIQEPGPTVWPQPYILTDAGRAQLNRN